MIKINRPGPQMLVISQQPVAALLRLTIWTGVVVIFYLVVLDDVALTGESSNGDELFGWQQWVLLLFPLFLLPYFFTLIRALLNTDELTIDGHEKTLSNKEQTLANFADIQMLQLRTVHGTCEEYRLSAILSSGRSVELVETEASAAIEALAAEISALMRVELTRTA